MSLENLEGMMKEVKKLQKKMERELQKMISSAVQEFFENHPGVISFRWQQYTPYFNDGEPCYFSVYPYFEDSLIVLNDNGKEYEEEYLWSSSKRHPYWNTVEGVSARKELKVLKKVFSKYEDQMEAIFGDHCEVVATKDGFEVSEYDHD